MGDPEAKEPTCEFKAEQHGAGLSYRTLSMLRIVVWLCLIVGTAGLAGVAAQRQPSAMIDPGDVIHTGLGGVGMFRSSRSKAAACLYGPCWEAVL